MSEGLVESAGKGDYQLVRTHFGLGEDAARLVDLLEHSQLSAHLTGFDLLAPYAHQFVFEFPHLVYAEPMVVESVANELASGGYVVQRADGRADGRARVSAPEPSKVVVLRKQPDPERYRVHGYIAPVEKAWVDALREASRGTVPLQFMELGRILRTLVDSGADLRYLRRYARQQGYIDRVDVATHGADGDPRADLAALRAGFVA
jgi:hypothetical protein